MYVIFWLLKKKHATSATSHLHCFVESEDCWFTIGLEYGVTAPASAHEIHRCFDEVVAGLLFGTKNVLIASVSVSSMTSTVIPC